MALPTESKRSKGGWDWAWRLWKLRISIAAAEGTPPRREPEWTDGMTSRGQTLAEKKPDNLSSSPRIHSGRWVLWHARTHAHSHTHACTHSRVHTCTHTHAHTHTFTCTHTCTHTHAHTIHIHAHSHILSLTHMHAHAHNTHTRTLTHTLSHTRTHTQKPSR